MLNEIKNLSIRSDRSSEFTPVTHNTIKQNKACHSELAKSLNIRSFLRMTQGLYLSFITMTALRIV
ncbi:MAG: hypothetical protein K0Q65_1265 [Clostridia bacterium]|nr:hypothetical protein [Clostridia bacterium]